MSIEQQLADLTAAIVNLTSAVNTAGQREASLEPPVGKPQEAEKPRTADTRAGASSPRIVEAPVDAPTTKEEHSAPPLDYDRDIKPLFLRFVAAKGRAAGIAFTQSYKQGAMKLSEAITPAQYAEVKARLDAALAEE